jgi:hypothetical protein
MLDLTVSQGVLSDAPNTPAKKPERRLEAALLPLLWAASAPRHWTRARLTRPSKKEREEK